VKLIIGARRTGKTTELIDWWLKNPEQRAIVTAGQQRANWIVKEIHEYGGEYRHLGSRRVMSITDYVRRTQGHNEFHEVVIDELDDCLALLLGSRNPIVAATLTPTDLKLLMPVGQ
jgi:F0F1-type ATP synthase alpha subunit